MGVGLDDWFATCPKGVESLLAAELLTLGANESRETVAGVHFSGSRAVAYRACLWSRLANRVLWPLARVAAADADALYSALRDLPWGDYFAPTCTIAVEFNGTNRDIRNTQFGAQRSKDAIVDWFAAHAGGRPSVERRHPDVRIHVRLSRDRAQVSLDLSGGSLHQRGYRLDGGKAPLKENLAAAILLRADWPGIAARGGALIDPMCGAGTLLLEGAMMAADIAPGIGRSRYGFESLALHDVAQWQALLADAKGRAERGRAAQLPEIRGYDASPGMVHRAQENIARLGLSQQVRVSAKPVRALKKPTHKPLPFGLVICNPPYGERLGDREQLKAVYRELGVAMLGEFGGWQGAVFTSEVELGRATGLRSHKRYKFYNGAIETQLFLFDLADNELREPQPEAERVQPLSAGAQMFANRLRKNCKRLNSWRKREGIECYRLYDADMPEYAVAVDIYGERVHVAEYKAPKKVDEASSERRFAEIKAALPEALGVPAESVVYKERRRQRGAAQYERQDTRGEFITVREGAASLLVNLTDYLDTGLFLDHRLLRLRFAREADGADFLNLFCYTGTATVHAALGGARSTTSVDTSNTYLDWLGRNLAANDLQQDTHTRVKADCVAWLEQAQGSYDLILLDPPSFSNSKSLTEDFDVQRDHGSLVRAAMRLLRNDGVLYFSNNRRGFQLDAALVEEFHCEDISAATIDVDFARNQRIHSCWRITAKT
ncbi:MAG: bifunctional 23S rRNA (guanine(2069)-N(7))-methyltransferase RlmK/23S rRNA (guanine(2445)-N(2))-methyltransferase RlmL [Halioglobus sp.]|nr:bifunctional 23S rRNA (guanine(2069)-N(7))-methyltransferase RlmK/23S rRNA (guanine(2445)-N(2))-methyltransferase RlmL [Halioglobus sp.]